MTTVSVYIVSEICAQLRLSEATHSQTLVSREKRVARLSVKINVKFYLIQLYCFDQNVSSWVMSVKLQR